MSDIVQLPGSKVERALDALKRSHHVGMNAAGQVFVHARQEPNPRAIAVRSKAFGRLVRKIAAEADDLLTTRDVQELAEQCVALAAADATELVVHLRSATEQGVGMVIDRGTPDRSRIALRDGQVHLIQEGSFALLHRPDSMEALPVPAETGDWEALKPYLNMVDDEQILLVALITFVIAHPKSARVGYPLLMVIGESGAGKSTLCRILRALIDPNTADVQLMPRNHRDLAASLANQYLLVVDNVRDVPNHMSDALCVVATGGTIAGRRLYTDDEEHQTRVHAPVVLNSIHPAVTQEDLASRLVTVHLRRMQQGDRKAEDSLLDDFSAALPGIYRGLLDLAALALQQRDTVKVSKTARMATFSRWCAALEGPLEMPPGTLQALYLENVQAARYETIMDNPLAMAVITLAKGRGLPWTGTPAALLRTLEQATEQEYLTRGSWPPNPNAMSKRLKALAQLLEEQDVYLEFHRGTQREITVQHRPPRQAAPSPVAPDGSDEDGGSSGAVKADL
jgi:energy-coupling factor transporter ATP-binding protein EcfA2